MDESEIRELVEKYFKDLDKTCCIRTQTNFGNSIFDMLILSGELMIGVEIKGDKDNFSRLKTQLLDYMYSCDVIYLATNEKHLPTDIPPFVGWLAIRNGKVKELRKPIEMPQRNMDFISLDVIEKTLKASNLPISWKYYTRELMKVSSQLNRTLLLNYWFADKSLNKDEDFKTKPFKNSIILKNYLSKLSHPLNNAWDEAPKDYKITSELSEEIDSLKQNFDKIISKIQGYTLNLKKHKEIRKKGNQESLIGDK